ncbi:hypothetical protein VE00_04008 [Pseudogymnoascus sp. WSF 3629]|jgi:hypothetical protein|nr:hypothetical protein VE00_04008 [Pseudogymnoascus sp. WSF 3629]
MSDDDDDVYVSIHQMRESMDELRGAARDICGKYLTARDDLRAGEAKIEILRQLNGRALNFDKLDPGALKRMMESMVQTSRKLGSVIVGIQVSLERLEDASKGYKEVRNEKMGNAWLMCQRLLLLADQLSEAHDVMGEFVEILGMEDQEGFLRDLKGGEKTRREVVGKLLKMMELWFWSTEWVIQLTMLREAVVSVREEVADEKTTMTMALNTMNPTAGEEGGDEVSEMDLQD